MYTDSSLINDNCTDKNTSVTVEPGNTVHVHMTG